MVKKKMSKSSIPLNKSYDTADTSDTFFSKDRSFFSENGIAAWNPPEVENGGDDMQQRGFSPSLMQYAPALSESETNNASFRRSGSDAPVGGSTILALGDLNGNHPTAKDISEALSQFATTGGGDAGRLWKEDSPFDEDSIIYSQNGGGEGVEILEGGQWAMTNNQGEPAQTARGGIFPAPGNDKVDEEHPDHRRRRFLVLFAMLCCLGGVILMTTLLAWNSNRARSSRGVVAGAEGDDVGSIPTVLSPSSPESPIGGDETPPGGNTGADSSSSNGADDSQSNSGTDGSTSNGDGSTTIGTDGSTSNGDGSQSNTGADGSPSNGSDSVSTGDGSAFNGAGDGSSSNGDGFSSSNGADGDSSSSNGDGTSSNVADGSSSSNIGVDGSSSANNGDGSASNGSDASANGDDTDSNGADSSQSTSGADASSSNGGDSASNGDDSQSNTAGDGSASNVDGSSSGGDSNGSTSGGDVEDSSPNGGGSSSTGDGSQSNGAEGSISSGSQPSDGSGSSPSDGSSSTGSSTSDSDGASSNEDGTTVTDSNDGSSPSGPTNGIPSAGNGSGPSNDSPSEGANGNSLEVDPEVDLPSSNGSNNPIAPISVPGPDPIQAPAPSTRAPVSYPEPTEAPTIRGCRNRVDREEDCYDDNSIAISYKSCVPMEGDWIALYPRSGLNYNDLSNDYVAWKLACGSRDCSGVPSAEGTVTFSIDDDGLDRQEYEAVLMREVKVGQPYEAVASSAGFAVQRRCIPATPAPVATPPSCRTRLDRTADCYVESTDILELSFQNCNPRSGDWVAMYPRADFDENNIAGGYVAWSWTCGSLDCSESPRSGRVGFSLDGLEHQEYVAVLLRDDGSPAPYELLSISAAFRISRTCS